MKTPAYFVFLAGLLLSTACSSNKNEKANFASSADTVSAAIVPQSPDSVKLVKTAGLEFKVKSVYESSRVISEKARVFGGMVIHHDIQSLQEKEKRVQISEDSLLMVSAYNTQADLTVKIPSQRLEEFMQEMTSIATFVYRSKLDVDDKTIDYVAASLRQQSRQELLNIAKQKVRKSSDATNLISEGDERIQQITDNKRVDEATRFSTVQLTLTQPPVISKEIVANDELPSYNTPFFYRLGMALATGWQAFLTLIVWIANLWMFIVTGLVCWYAVQYYRRKRKDMLL